MSGRVQNSRGFTLIELMVAVAIFSIVMLVAVGALVTVVDANRKAQALTSVLNNLNFALEGMSRTIRVGTTYHCKPGNANPPPVTGGPSIETPQNCQNGGKLIAFEAQDGDPTTGGDQVIYRQNGTIIERSTDGGTTFIPITSPNVRVDDLDFYVLGAARSDNFQPRVIITIRGEAGVSVKTRTEFNLQTSATQRILDI